MKVYMDMLPFCRHVVIYAVGKFEGQEVEEFNLDPKIFHGLMNDIQPKQ